MAAPIRPAFSPLPPVQPQPVEAARASQRAFFSQALAAVQAPEPTIAPVHTQPTSPTAPAAANGQPAPDRPMRPGSLLDIRI